MKRYSTIFLIAIILLSCQGEDGQPGLNSLIGVAEEGPGAHCENGGFKLQSGLDKDRNGALNPDEVETTNFVCNGKTGSAGSNGTNGASSIFDMIPEPVSDACPNGGLKVITGLDLNGDGQLTGNEVATTQYLCNGTNGKNGNGMPDLVTRLEIPFGWGTTSSVTPVITGNLYKFNKADYATDSIVFASEPYNYGGGNLAEVELYNITDNVAVEGSLLSSGNAWQNRKFQVSDNVYKNLPSKEITLGVRFRSTVEGQLATSGYYGSYLLIYKK
ncbi:hypothetical protein SAMN04488109_3110 [Chryseolinea serpens]|uniref:DUF7151 domain-containing protein n=1 Tax=Chryseolinea serpens TaxID=947013 RepID=A0A1M5R001_9BACT|nr:hypothetical protein [Chryseolinea serpens]SHH19488.1 hypothetical protein SAMN04488109_3110 [Chryseolinea serpens]